MSSSYKVLDIAPPSIGLRKALSKELGIPEILSQILINRGIKTLPEAEKFLKPDLSHLYDPFSFPEMPKAVSLIKKASQKRKKVMLFGDYDVDGITSIALLKNTLSKLNLDMTCYLPHRVKEGYGLNKNIFSIIKEKKIKLLITADCGTNNIEEVRYLRKQAVEVIISDHHEPVGKKIAPASSIINPKLKNSKYKYRNLAGVGVAYKLCQAVSSHQLFEDLDLVSLGTIADVVPLTGENRVIVKEGLAQLNITKKIGLKALIESSGIKDKKITTTFVSYIIGPRINASSRMDTAEIALKLMLSQDVLQAKELAKIIEGFNRQRQKIEGKILEEARGIIEKDINFKEHKIIVLAQDNWHQGVLGIVAAKIADRFYRPTIIISKNAHSCKGSGRSIKNFHLFNALLECKDLLKTFGGHSHAVGLVITAENIEKFREHINRLAHKRLNLEDLLPRLDIDMELRLSDLNEKIISSLDALEPFGTENPEPLFYTRDLKLKGTPQVLGRNTLKFWVTDGNFTYSAIGFGMADYGNSLVNAPAFDLVYKPRMDTWKDNSGIILEIEEVFFK